MNKETLQEYSTRISQANRSELVVITFEVILDGIECAREDFEKEDMESFVVELKRAQKLLNELMASLDYQYAVSRDLMSLYVYVNKQLIMAIMQKTTECLDSAQMVMNRLLTGFKKMSEQDTSKPLMLNTQKLYAGLTYGKGHLNETFVSVNEAMRGFRA